MRMGGYVARTVGGALLLVMLVILGLDVIAAVVDQLDDLQGGYTFVHALTYVACRCRPGSMNTCPSLPWSAAWPAWGPWRAAASWWPCAPPACRCSASAPMPSTPRCG